MVAICSRCFQVLQRVDTGGGVCRINFQHSHCYHRQVFNFFDKLFIKVYYKTELLRYDSRGRYFRRSRRTNALKNYSLFVLFPSSIGKSSIEWMCSYVILALSAPEQQSSQSGSKLIFVVWVCLTYLQRRSAFPCPLLDSR